MAKLEPIDKKQTNWVGLWYHPEYGGYSSAVISLAELRKFKGMVRVYVRKNKFYKGGTNGRPNYNFCIKDANSKTFVELEVEDEPEELKCAKEDENGEWYTNEGERLYTESEVEEVKAGACYDGQRGYYPGDLLISDYV